MNEREKGYHFYTSTFIMYCYVYHYHQCKVEKSEYEAMKVYLLQGRVGKKMLY